VSGDLHFKPRSSRPVLVNAGDGGTGRHIPVDLTPGIRLGLQGDQDRSHVPSLQKRASRYGTVRYGPNSTGRSRHAHPVRNARSRPTEGTVAPCGARIQNTDRAVIEFITARSAS
jgi:hypothetical protein